MRQVSETTGTAPRLWGSAASLFGMLGVAAALTIAFNLGSFAAEYQGIVAHARLLLELKARADKLREARYGPAAAAGAALDS